MEYIIGFGILLAIAFVAMILFNFLFDFLKLVVPLFILLFLVIGAVVALFTSLKNTVIAFKRVYFKNDVVK